MDLRILELCYKGHRKSIRSQHGDGSTVLGELGNTFGRYY